MSHPRPIGRGRLRRACRLVSSTPAERRRWPFAIETASAYQVALSRVHDLQSLFPEFYQAHVADLRLTPRALLAVVCAFLSLVNRELFTIEDNFVLEVPADPLRALAFVEDGSRDPLITLEEAASWLCQPRPELYGVGIEGILEDETPQQLLTLALWHLCRATNWAIGVDVGDVIGFSYVDQELAEYLLKLPPLPQGTDMQQVTQALALPPWSDGDEFDEVIAYPFARTDNPMANTTNYELDIVYGGETDSTWSEAKEIAEAADEAAKIAQRYNRWGRAIDADPRAQLRKLTKALHAAADRCSPIKPAKARTLAEIILDLPAETEVPV